eukprot:scaffold75270_cov62-Attheya_sp.AAC.2
MRSACNSASTVQMAGISSDESMNGHNMNSLGPIAIPWEGAGNGEKGAGSKELLSSGCQSGFKLVSKFEAETVLATQ